MRADSCAATVSRSGAMPAVSAYWTAAGSVSARAAAAAIRSRGSRSAAGRPPARLITSGRAVRVSRSRMAEPRTSATRRARVIMVAPGDRGHSLDRQGRGARRVGRPLKGRTDFPGTGSQFPGCGPSAPGKAARVDGDGVACDVERDRPGELAGQLVGVLDQRERPQRRGCVEIDDPVAARCPPRRTRRTSGSGRPCGCRRRGSRRRAARRRRRPAAGSLSITTLAGDDHVGDPDRQRSLGDHDLDLGHRREVRRELFVEPRGEPHDGALMQSSAASA